jgi:hypothetical protein
MCGTAVPATAMNFVPAPADACLAPPSTFLGSRVLFIEDPSKALNLHRTNGSVVCEKKMASRRCRLSCRQTPWRKKIKSIAIETCPTVGMAVRRLG